MSSPLRIAMLGMIPGNGHPWSWSALINGFEPSAMAKCPFPVIPAYLNQHSPERRMEGFAVTHIWTDDPADAPMVAAAARISHVVSSPTDVIGEVDAVIIATDNGADHARRARPFIEAGLPVFVDKPLAITVDELRQFRQWQAAGGKILSSSGLRYAPALEELKGKDWRWLTAVTANTWERYGIHALEPLFVLAGPGFIDARSESAPGSDLVHLRHQSGLQCTVAAIETAYGSSGVIQAYGETVQMECKMKDTYNAFRNQLLAVTSWFKSGEPPYPFQHTEELMAILIAAIRSRSTGERVPIQAVLDETAP